MSITVNLSLHQTNPTCPVRIAETTGITPLTMGRNINGLHHSAANKQQERYTMDSNSLANKDGTLHCMPQDHESKGFSRPLPLTNSQTPRTAEQYCIRPRNLVYLRLLEASNRSTQNITQPQHGIPPTDGRVDGTSQCHPRAIPPGILQLSTGRLGETPAECRIMLQQHSNQNHKNNPLLRQLQISHSIHARPGHTE